MAFLLTGIISQAANSTKNGNANLADSQQLFAVPILAGLAQQQCQECYPGLCTLGPSAMDSSNSRKRPETDQQKVSNHFLKNKI